MSENEPKTLSVDEFVKQKIKECHDESIRTKSFEELAKGSKPTRLIPEDTFFNWMSAIQFELENLYTIIDRLLNSDRYSVNVSKQILGLSELASAEELSTRTREFGEFINILMKKKADWEQEEKQKERFT